MNSDTSVVDSDLTDGDYLMDDDSTVPSMQSDDQVIDLTVDGQMDLASKQRQRRKIRMEIMKRKRERKMTSHLQRPTADRVSCIKISDAVKPVSVTEITDPKLLRKLRNRESAARSRQKLVDLIDALTCELCDRYVTYRDLQDQLNYLTHVETASCSPSVRSSSPSCVSQDSSLFNEMDNSLQFNEWQSMMKHQCTYHFDCLPTLYKSLSNYTFEPQPILETINAFSFDSDQSCSSVSDIEDIFEQELSDYLLL